MFSSWSGSGGGDPLLEDTIALFFFLTIGIFLFVCEDVFFLQPFSGRQLSSISSGGQGFKAAVLGQSAAEADRAERDQSQGRSRPSVQQE